MRKHQGFTLIELVAFILISGLLASTILLALNTVLLKTPIVLQNGTAAQTAKKCMEWFIGQRHLNLYSSITCPSTTVPTFCTAPSGYTLAVNIQCTTISGDANYKTITITVGGKGDAKLTSIIANY